ncbi:zinc-dependent alcohol dehydrogenase [Cellulomonas xiejunii]|uniref:zinc-dependent alcohol dehydrogenase n=1 Tax=Cellulomonas xiejunii TaxID=2968083 RepID=UPI001D0E64D7|nr:alcohol dehydrogenase catalytic domain-containing protein [Cellulomonas xiejunii]MCC2314017.1 alcohol dehydrogenase catalytic domain-containing protein [Cellulomonas xiejunii]
MSAAATERDVRPGDSVSSTRAQLLSAVRTLEPTELYLGPLGADELLVEVRATGVCGSDRAAFLGTHPYKSAPCVLGHELSGVVVQAGSAVREVAVGDSVASAASAHCGRCTECARGAANLCANKTSLSHGGWHGSFAERVVLRERMIVRLPDGLTAEAGALVEPLAIGVHAAALVGDRRPHNVVVLGCGTIGLATLMAARAGGAQHVLCVDRGAVKGDLARRAGASAYVDSRAVPSVVRAVLDAVAGPVDVTFVAAGYEGVVDDAVAVTRPGGAVVLVSYFDGAPQVDLNAVVARGITVVGSALCTVTDLARAVASLVDGEVDPTVLITHKFPLDQAQVALELMVADGETVGKIMLTPGGGRD